jgi:rsbT antagonist protein RsbS
VTGRVPVLRLGSNLLVALQGELEDAVAEAMQQDLLAAIERSGARGLILDISGLAVVDSYVARVLVDTGRMARLMGATTVLVGMRPEVAATLVQMGFAMDGVETALDVEQGLAALSPHRS